MKYRCARSEEIKSQLASALCDEMEARDMTQREFAALIGFHRKDVAELASGKLKRFTIDRLIRTLDQLGIGVTISVKRVR